MTFKKIPHQPLKHLERSAFLNNSNDNDNDSDYDNDNDNSNFV